MDEGKYACMTVYFSIRCILTSISKRGLGRTLDELRDVCKEPMGIVNDKVELEAVKETYPRLLVMLESIKEELEKKEKQPPLKWKW
jgi:hypothetical protein